MKFYAVKITVREVRTECNVLSYMHIRLMILSDKSTRS